MVYRTFPGETLPPTYIVWHISAMTPIFYDDDEFRAIDYDFEILIVSKTDYTELTETAFAVLTQEGYAIKSAGPEMMDPGLEYYFIPIIVKYTVYFT
jgi:hypothetical protein